MNRLVENNCIKEFQCGTNFSYILNDPGVFSSTEYKVLQNQSGSSFVKCMKMMYNGKIQLYYLTNNLKTFESIIPLLEPENFVKIVSYLFSDIINVKNNGFLSCQNIDIDFEHIYIDPLTYKVFLVYLPVSDHFYEDYSAFENEIRTGLVKLISETKALSSAKTEKLSSDLSNGTYSIEDIFLHIKGEYSNNTENAGTELLQNKVLHIVAINAPMHTVIEVTKDDFIIGKKADCDGIIDFNNMISRRHCKINKMNGKYTITDLQSSNGTYVNKVRLQPNQPCLIKDGDIIRMANSNFQVKVN